MVVGGVAVHADAVHCSIWHFREWNCSTWYCCGENAADVIAGSFPAGTV